MFGFDKMFDFNRDGKLDSWERAAQFQFMDEMMKKISLMKTMRSILLQMPDLIMMSWNLWIRMSLIFNRRVQLMKSNIETKMKLMERRQAVHANKIQALMLMITVMQIPEKEKNRKILKAVRVSTALLWILTCVEDLVLMIRKR